METADFRRRTWALAACASVLAATSFASAAQGAIAGGGQQFSTNRPDVVSATINDTLVQPYVDLCFDTAIQPDPGLANGDFDLTGVNVRPVDIRSPINVSQHPTDTSCLRLLFAGTVNLGSYSVLEVAEDVVRPSGGAAQGNKEAAAQLDNTDVEAVIGRIGGPNLLSAIPVDTGGGPGSGAVQYNFDKNIVVFDESESSYGYYGPDGEFELGDFIVLVSGKSVIIGFDDLVGDDPAPSVATRFFALSGAAGLADRSDPADFVNDSRAESIGGAVPGRPDLIGVSEVPGQQGVYDMHYNQLIQPLDNSSCRAILSVGDSYGADSVQVIGNGSVLRVTFNSLTSADPDAELDSDDEVVRITDEGRPNDGCVQDLNTSRSSTTKSLALRLGDNIPGFTSGPDLTGCLGSPTSNEVTFYFDELLSLLPANNPTASRLRDLHDGRWQGRAETRSATSLQARSRSSSRVADRRRTPLPVTSTATRCTIATRALVRRSTKTRPEPCATTATAARRSARSRRVAARSSCLSPVLRARPRPRSFLVLPARPRRSSARRRSR